MLVFGDHHNNESNEKTTIIQPPFMSRKFIICSNGRFQKKDWKNFNISFVEDLAVAQSFYSGNIDYENKNEFNFLSTSKVNLHGSIGNSINHMSYTSYYFYDYKTEEETKVFYNNI